MENSREIPQNTRNESTIRPSNPTSGHIPQQDHTSKRHMYRNIHCRATDNSQGMGATYMSINREMDKEDVVQIHNGTLLSHRKAMGLGHL